MLKRISLRLEKQEILILTLSLVTTVITYFIGEERNLLNLISSLIGVTALIYVAKGYIIGQLFCVIFAIFYGIISYQCAYYGEMITYLFMAAPTSLFSFFEWLRHPYGDTREVEVAKPTRKKIIIMFIATAAVTGAFYFILKALGNASLIVSTFSVTTSFLAAYLMVLRSSYYALAYALNDIVLIILWTVATVSDPSNLPMVVCFIIFLLNDAYGFINWKRMERNQKNSKKI